MPKNIFLPHFEIVQNFHYFVSNKFNIPKSVSNVVEMFLLMSGTNNFAKKYFLTPCEIVQNFQNDFLSKVQFSKKCLKCCRNVSFDEWNSNIFLEIFTIL